MQRETDGCEMPSAEAAAVVLEAAINARNTSNSRIVGRECSSGAGSSRCLEKDIKLFAKRIELIDLAKSLTE